MPPQRPTTLKLMTRHCPKALDHYEAGVAVDRSVFAAGTAAHDVLHALATTGPEAVEPTVLAMLAVGREGIDAEPPIHPDAVFEGRDIALAWYERVGGVLGSPEARYELGLAFREDWSRTRYDDDRAWFRIRLDVFDEVYGDDEELPARGVVVRDYKTAWPTDASELGTIQMRAQALAVVEAGLADGVDFVRREVVNLRTGKVFHEDLWLVDEGHHLEEWKRDLEMLIRAAHARPRVARPGAHCLQCPFVRVCEAPRELLQTNDPDQVVVRYAAAVALADGLAELAKEATADHALVVDGTAVGYRVRNRRRATADAPDALWRAWTVDADLDERTVGVARGLLTAMQVGVSQVQAIAKTLSRDARDDLLERALEVDATREWGVERAETFVEAPTKPRSRARRSTPASPPSAPSVPPPPAVPSVPGPPGAPF